MPGFDWFLAEEYAATVRFGLWDEMLAKSAPDPKLQAADWRISLRPRRGARLQGEIGLTGQATLAAAETPVQVTPADAPLRLQHRRKTSSQ